jgi:hypothetical protein
MRYAEIVESAKPPLEGVGFISYRDETIETAEYFHIQEEPESTFAYIAKVSYRITDYEVSHEGYKWTPSAALVCVSKAGTEIYLRNRDFIVAVEVIKNTIKPARKPIRGKPAKGTKWPARLNSQGIVAHIENLASAPVDVETMADFFFGKTATLKVVRIADLVEGDPDHNLASADLEQQYARMDPATTPPLVVSFDGEVLDGNHRYRALKGLGITEVLAYVVK